MEAHGYVVSCGLTAALVLGTQFCGTRVFTPHSASEGCLTRLSSTLGLLYVMSGSVSTVHENFSALVVA